MHIRLAQLKDASNLKTLNDLFNGDNCNSLNKIVLSLEQNTFEIVAVAEQDDELIGFCCGQMFCSFCYGVYYGEITELFVLEEFRKRGVGRGLMTFMERQLTQKGAVNLQLFTGKENTTAQSFYKSLGYIKSDEQLFRKRGG